MGQAAVRVAVVNDYELVVAGIAGVLAPYADRVEVVELDTRVPVQAEVDVVLYDSFGQSQGRRLDVTGLLGDSHAKLVVFSWNTDPELVEQSLERGAAGYLTKGLTGAELVDALERVHAGERVTPLQTPMRDGDDFGRWPGAEHGLSAREAEVLALLCQGLGNQEITEKAFLGMNTVKTHIRTLYRKIGVQSRTQAVLWGIDHGFRPDRSRHIRED
ncbi:response regulator transcription factor [Nocardioides koreensis]